MALVTVRTRMVAIAMKVTPAQQRAASAGQAYARQQAEQRADQQRRQIRSLAQLECLRGLPEPTLQVLAPNSLLRAFSAGTTILNEGAASNALYIVLRGSLVLTLHDRNRNEVLVGLYSRGDCFGEGALFGDLFRGAEVRTATTCYLIQIPLEAVRAAIIESPELEAALRGIYRHHLVASTLGRVPVFCDLSPLERGNIAGLLAPHQYETGELIIHEGQPGAALYLIESGQIAVEHANEAVAFLDAGTFVGEISLLTGEPHNADIRALTPVVALQLPRQALIDLLERQPALAHQLKAIVEQRLNQRSPDDPARLRLVGDAVSRGVLRGAHLLVRDTRLCPDDCQRCVDACATRHGHARLRTNGTPFGQLDIIDSCRQCRVGAECVAACPEHAIEWNNDGALIITSACTGCGACVPACPYDAVALVDMRHADQNPLWLLWQRLTKSHGPTIPLESLRPVQHADKCDYCHGYDDLACVTACPTGALRLVAVEELFPL